MNLLKGEKLTKSFRKKSVLNGVDINLKDGESIGIVGESGSGKSTLVNIIGHLIEPSSGQVLYKNQSIHDMNKKDYYNFRKNVQFVFQSPKESLHPYLKIIDTLKEPFFSKGSKRLNKEEINEIIEIWLDRVKLSKDVLQKYPNQLSGGQAQRVAIVRAMIMNPKVVILDEAVSALDILVQHEVLEILKELREIMQTSYIFITHDIGTIEHLTDRVYVMKNGDVIETGKTAEILKMPKSPYTKQLIESTY